MKWFEFKKAEKTGKIKEPFSEKVADASDVKTSVEMLPATMTPAPGLKGKLQYIWKEYGYLLLAAGIPAMIMYLIYLARGVYPFGNSCVLVLDLNGQYVYFYEALRNAVYGDQSLIYSFSRALGGEFMGIFAYYIASPFSLIVCLFPQKNILEALLFIFLLKTAITGFTMGYYLHKTTLFELGRRKSGQLPVGGIAERNRIGIVAFSILYSLTSYAVVQQHNSMWIDAVMWLPLITLGIEDLVRYGKYKKFVFFLSLTILSNFYIGYMVCLYVAAYFFFYLFGFKKDNYNNPNGETRHGIKSFVRIAFFSLLSVGIAAIIILTAYYSLQFGKNTFSNPNWEFTQRFNLLDLFYKFLPCSYDTVRPAGWPFVYCGVLTLMLVPAFFASDRRGMREKIAYGCMILFFVLSFSINTLDLIWHGFQKPNWLNYRYSFMLCFLLIVIAYKAYTDLRYISKNVMFGASAVIAALIIVVQRMPEYEKSTMNEKLNATYSDWGPFWMPLILIGIYFVLLMFLRKTNNRERIASILVFFICIEVFINGLCEINALDDDVVYTKHSYYTDFMDTNRPITDALQEYDSSFYRAEKTYYRKTNDNMALGLRGLSNSTSTLNKDTIHFLESMGYTSKSHWSQYCGGEPIADSLLNIKYIITDRDMSPYYGQAVLDQDDFSNETEKYWIYQNQYALSLAFAASDKMQNFNIEDYATPFERLNAMVTAILGEEETVEIFKPAQLTSTNTTNITESSASGHIKYAKTDEDKDAYIDYTYEIPYKDVTVTEIYEAIYEKTERSFTAFDTSSILSESVLEDLDGIVTDMVAYRAEDATTPYFYLIVKAKDEKEKTANDLLTSAVGNYVTDLQAQYPALKEASVCAEQNGRYLLYAVLPTDIAPLAVDAFLNAVPYYGLYFYYDTDYIRDCKLTVTGTTASESKMEFSSELRRLASLGYAKADTVKLRVKLADDDYPNLYIRKSQANYVYYIDWDVFCDAFTRMAEVQVELDEEYEEHHLTGSITTKEANQLIMTSIPYDNGWKIYVDGERVDLTGLVKMGFDEYEDEELVEETGHALIGFYIDDAGEHTVEFKYEPTALVLGRMISLISLLLFLLLIIFGRYLRKISIVKKYFCVPDAPLPISLPISEEQTSDTESVSERDDGDIPSKTEPNTEDDKTEAKKDNEIKKDAQARAKEKK